MERFFGLHFDFHADNESPIGIRTNPLDIEWYINEAKPDFIQCDSKGHPGISSYPTKIGKAAENLKTDNLKIWSDVAKSKGIPLYVHHSGIFDIEYKHKYPDQVQIKKDGSATDSISLFSNYAETYLIPQIKEMIDMYDIAGIWMDGECWALCDDYSQLAQKYIGKLKSKDERDAALRNQFVKYLKKCGDELHKYKPGFKYISNWAYSSYMPEKPIEGVLDSLSGDYPCNDSLHSARYEGRCLAAQHMPWDLMCWSFMMDFSDRDFYITKSQCQIEQEATAVLMLGGGFQLYIMQNKDGSAKRTEYKGLKNIGEFIRARHMLFKKETFAQVGIYYSKTDRYKNGNIYNAKGATSSLIGSINATLTAQYTVNVVYEYQVSTIKNYNIIIVPEWTDMSSEEKQSLINYAENGGKLLVMGAQLTKQISKICGFQTGDIINEEQTVLDGIHNSVRPHYRYIHNDDGRFECIIGDITKLNKGKSYIYSETDLRDKVMPAYDISDYGKGKIAFIPFDFGKNFFKTRTQIKADFLKNILNQLSRPIIEISKSNIDISVLEKEDGIYINLLNMYQNRMDNKYEIYDEVPPLYDINLIVHKCCRSVLMPLGESFTFEITPKETIIHLKCLNIHSIIELTF